MEERGHGKKPQAEPKVRYKYTDINNCLRFQERTTKSTRCVNRMKAVLKHSTLNSPTVLYRYGPAWSVHTPGLPGPAIWPGRGMGNGTRPDYRFVASACFFSLLFTKFSAARRTRSRA